VAHLPGKFNDDGTVDAADYVVWRKNDGTLAGYDAWRANFGATSGSGPSSGATVPEPKAVVFLLCGISAFGRFPSRTIAYGNSVGPQANILVE
jgi:hypothetical protein